MTQTAAPSYSAFISYASPDVEKAQEICASLENRAFRCWIAPRDVRAGHEYGNEIIRGIEQSRCLVLLLSEAANNSVFVRREVERAVSKKKPVFPVRIEDVMPSASLELFVSTTHWIDAWSGRLVDHVDRLARDLSDDSVLAEATAVSTRIARKRRHLPRWIVSTAAFVAIIVGVVVANHFTRPKETGPAASADAPDNNPFRPPKIDPSTITADKLTPEFSFIIDTGHGVKVTLKSSPEIEGYLNLAKASYRIGDGKWRDTFGTIVHFTGHQGWLDDLAASRSITMKWDLMPERVGRSGTIGPFTFPIDYELQIRKAYKERALDRRYWLERDNKDLWSFEYLRHIFPAVSKVYFGATPDINIMQPIEQPQSLFDARAVDRLADKYRRDPVTPAELKNAETVYMQLEFFDGTKSDVRSVSRTTTVATPLPVPAPSTPAPTPNPAPPGEPISIPDLGWQKGSPSNE
jgi:hypothetical protein